MSTIHVSSQREFLAALKMAKGGDTINLADGNYGSLSITRDYSSEVKIVSDTPKGAVFDKLTVSGASNVALDGITATGGVRIENWSSDITLRNSDMGNTLYVRNSTAVTLEDNDVDAGTFGLVLNVVRDFVAKGNTIHGASQDLVRIVGDSNGLFENNVVYDAEAKKGTHADLLQLFPLYGKTPHDIVIRGNLLYDDNSTGNQTAQGIFLDDAAADGYRNILIEDNMIRTSNTNSLYINRGVENVVIRNNSLMSGDGDGGGIIRLVGSANTGVTVENNVAKLLVDGNGVSDIGENFFYGRWADLSEIFQGTTGSAWSDFLPVKGSVIDFPSGHGAITRLAELLSGEKEPVKEDQSNVHVPPPVTPFPDALSPIVSLSGELSFDSTEALTIAHDQAFRIEEGTIAFSFKADEVNWRRSLLSKDDRGDDNQMSIWVQEGQLKAAFQNGAETEIISSAKGLRKGADYAVSVSFDDDSVSLYLDGKLVGERDFDMNLSGNDADIHLGAGTIYLSRTQSSGQVYGYDGTISDFAVYDQAMTPDELAALKAGTWDGHSLV